MAPSRQGRDNTPGDLSCLSVNRQVTTTSGLERVEAPRTLRVIVGLFFPQWVFELDFHLCADYAYRYRK
jgi:hypothetical protein